jgi:hypothetical protein
METKSGEIIRRDSEGEGKGILLLSFQPISLSMGGGGGQEKEDTMKGRKDYTRKNERKMAGIRNGEREKG